MEGILGTAPSYDVYKTTASLLMLDSRLVYPWGFEPQSHFLQGSCFPVNTTDTWHTVKDLNP